MTMSINTCVVSTLLVAVISLIAYASYLLHKNRDLLTESQERRISTIMLMMLFFVLALLYSQVWDRNTFLGLWFLYAVYHSVKEIKRIVGIDCSRRATDIAKECSSC